MTQPQLEIQLIAMLTAVACAIPGVFLVLRKMAMISDAISHSILLGIVIGFFITQDLNSPVLIILAGFVGVITVVLVEAIQKTKLVKEDTAIGLVFPALFALGVILISMKAGDVHIDIDAVLLGEIAFAPFDRVYWNEMDLGPKALWIISAIFMLLVILLLLFYKELKISTFDPSLSMALGISPIIIHYALMSVSSITIVGAFDAVGAVLVVALMIVPASTAYLLTHSLRNMLWISVVIGIISSISGYWLAWFLDASIAGSIATILGLIFGIVYLTAPKNGFISQFFVGRRQKREVMMLTCLLHLNSLGLKEDKEEREIGHMYKHFKWTKKQADIVVRLALDNDLIILENQLVYLTQKGVDFSQKALEYITTNRDDKIEGMKDSFLLFRG